MKTTTIGSVNKPVTAIAGRGCSCRFPLEDKYGKYTGYRPHDNWTVFTQDHDNSNFATYLECNSCGYQLAKKYWTEEDRSKTDYAEHLTGDEKLSSCYSGQQTKDHYHVSFKPELSWTVHVLPTDSKEDALSTFHRWIRTNEISIEECLTIVQSDPDCNYCNSGEGK
jgi:hypothetical protein